VAVGVYVAVAVGVGEGVSVAVAVPNMATVGGRFRAATVIRPTNNAITLATVKRRRLLANPGPCRFFNIKRISYKPTAKYREGEYARLFKRPGKYSPFVCLRFWYLPGYCPQARLSPTQPREFSKSILTLPSKGPPSSNRLR
jgi:hypothetical protein